jgi:DNA-binding GntR family transcriptional regulator
MDTGMEWRMTSVVEEKSVGAAAGLSYKRVADQLREMILTNELEPGDWIRVQAMAQRFGVSGQPVREALQLLQGEGLLKLEPNRGAQIYGLTRERLHHIYELRAALESYVARRFAEQASYLDYVALEKIQKAHDEATEARDIDEVLRINRQFHGFISGHSKNIELQGHITRYLTLTRTVRLKVGYDERYFERVRREHHEFLDAFRRHDAAAAGEIGLRHVIGTQNEVLEAYF